MEDFIMRIILASKSPRRKELMDLLNVNYDIIVSDADETLENGLSMEEQSKKLALAKAKAVFDITSGDRIVIGADTLVYKDDEKLGKPGNADNAFNMLQKLKNSTHQVCTGIAVLVQKGDLYSEFIDCSSTSIHIKDMTDIEIQEWIDTGKAFDKAGAYAIQDEFAKFIDKIDGNYSSVVGLPIDMVYYAIKKFI